MKLYSNRAVVLDLIRRATECYPDWPLDKEALQKSLYFFNLKSECFRFRWGNFGPYSAETQQIIHDLGSVKRITMTPWTGEPDRFLVKYVDKTPRLKPPHDPDGSLKASLDSTMEFAAGRHSSDLRLLASVHYWAERCDGGNMAEYVHGMLMELKQGFTMEDVNYALRELGRNGLLEGPDGNK